MKAEAKSSWTSSTLKNHRYANNLTLRRCYVTADIHPQDIDIGRTLPPNELINNTARKRGYLCDEPGYLIPAELGDNYDVYNYFPQSKHMDVSTLENDKKAIRDHLTSGSNRYAQMTFAFEYTPNECKWYRPTFLYYRFRLFENGKLVKEMCNKLLNVVVTCKEDVFD